MKPFTFGIAPPPDPLAQKEAAARPSDTSLYSVTVRGPNRNVTTHRIKKHTKMGEIFMKHATRWLTDPGSLQFLVNEKCNGDHQTHSWLNLTVNNEIDCSHLPPPKKRASLHAKAKAHLQIWSAAVSSPAAATKGTCFV